MRSFRSNTDVSMQSGRHRAEEGEHSDMIFVAVIMLLSMAAAFVAFSFVFDGYTKHFGTPGALATQAVAQAASSAASGPPSTAVADARAAWGQFGDYIGGMLNPLLSFFSFIALSLALLLQARQVGLSRTELRETRRERAEAQDDARAQLKAARTLAAAQIRTARAQERAVNLLNKQLEETSATARAQEKSARALMLHARITTLTAQMNNAGVEDASLATDLHRAKTVLGTHPDVIEKMQDRREWLAQEMDRLQTSIAALEAEFES